MQFIFLIIISYEIYSCNYNILYTWKYLKINFYQNIQILYHIDDILISFI